MTNPAPVVRSIETMATLADRIRAVTDLTPPQAEYLRLLCSSWQVLADLSFSDLLLYVKDPQRADTFRVCAQLRPFTSQTLYPDDMVGTVVTQPEQPIVERAYREGRIWTQEDPVLVDGIPIQMDAVPVRFDGAVTAVVTKEGSPATSRRLGRLEQVYLDAADKVSEMISLGYFPLPETPRSDWPRVGDGLIVLDAEGCVEWASPNALSWLSRVGVKHNILGRPLDDLGIGETPVKRVLAESSVADGELVRGDAHIQLRVFALFNRGGVSGALVLSRDISDIRQRERLISVKDATIREVHHRVKNNLQTIASLLRLQSRRLHSEEAVAALQESVMRIGSIALVHETLSAAPSDVADFGDVARRIVRMVAEGLALPDRHIEFRVTGSTGPLGADLATPLAVTVTELLQNAMEHAFPNGRGGTVTIHLSGTPFHVEVVVQDDGVGLQRPEDISTGSRLGLQIVRSLVSEMGGSIEIAVEKGTKVSITVPVRSPST